MANKLELTWFEKEKIINVEPRLLIENSKLSHKNDSLSLFNDTSYDNMLIHGDNLIALKSLLNDYSGKIKCVYIDPPYNTGSAFEQYDDNLEHSTWLSLMKPRLEILRELLSDDGSIWISIDDDEQAYLKVLCDEIFGRKNFINNVIWEKKYSPQNDAKWLSDNHDFIMVYAKNKDVWRPNLLPRTAEMNARYKNPDNDPRGPWKSSDCLVKTYSADYDYPITLPSGRVVSPPAGRCWMTSPERFQQLRNDNRIWFGPNGDNVPALKRFLSDVRQGFTPLTIWKYEEVGHTQDARNEVKAFNNQSIFATPKPEKLIQRILFLATKKGDWVLDSFLGSGTTAAVAQKMGRRWIGIELGEHAYTHCKPRLDMVIDYLDKKGITESENYHGGGGYRFYELAPTLINEDSFGQPVINKEYNSDMLAAAIAMHEGFKYEPDPTCYWKQAINDNNTYLYVTTKHVNEEMINSIKAELTEDEFLVLVCKSYDEALKRVARNITIKKIPQSLLKNCEFGVDNYNLNIICPPEYEEEDE